MQETWGSLDPARWTFVKPSEEFSLANIMPIHLLELHPNQRPRSFPIFILKATGLQAYLFVGGDVLFSSCDLQYAPVCGKRESFLQPEVCSKPCKWWTFMFIGPMRI